MSSSPASLEFGLTSIDHRILSNSDSAPMLHFRPARRINPRSRGNFVVKRSEVQPSAMDCASDRSRVRKKRTTIMDRRPHGNVPLVARLANPDAASVRTSQPTKSSPSTTPTDSRSPDTGFCGVYCLRFAPVFAEPESIIRSLQTDHKNRSQALFALPA